MSTRESILEVSLLLFSKKGFDGVSVREIAREVGVRESALYKHFKNKEDILDKVILETRSRIAKAYVTNQVPEAIWNDIVAGYRNITEEKLCEIAWNLFQLYTKDPMVSNYRKLLMREQSSNKLIGAIYNQSFLEGAVMNQSKTFQALVEGEIFIKENPKIIALHFYGPILLLFQQYDCEPEKEEEIHEILNQHVTQFSRIYRK